MTYCTPYLLALGLTKSKISLVWIAGPLSGLIMQPIVGVISDRSKSRYGRRRPFMVCGTIAVSVCLLMLGWTREIVEVFASDKETVKRATIALAVLSIYGIDFAINAVQGSCRSLIVDTLPTPKQQLGSSWASRMVAVGQLIGYAAGAADLNNAFGGRLGNTQFKSLVVVAAMMLSFTVGITCWAVSERVLISDGQEGNEKLGAVQTTTKILKTAMNLPRGIAAICFVQFWAWIGNVLPCQMANIALILLQAGFPFSFTAPRGWAKSICDMTPPLRSSLLRTCWPRSAVSAACR